MTTIAYHHDSRTIAVDSRKTMSGIVVNDRTEKWRYVDGDLYFFAGSDGGEDLFIEAHKTGSKANPDIADCCALMITKDGVCKMLVISNDWLPLSCVINYNIALGSGDNFALAAMDHGKNAADSVRYASTRDIYTGGPVHAYDIAKAEFIE